MDALDALTGLLGPDTVFRSSPELEHYALDWSRGHVASPLGLALPRSAQDVQAIVRWAVERQVALVPSGGRTGLSGGAVAARGELVVSLERMNRILAFDPVDRTLTVEAGVTTLAVQQAAETHGLCYPVDFASRGSSQIGGNLATNAGGIKVLRHGMTREWVAGLKAVAGTGALLDLNRGLVKNATGYDLRHLFIGSEGTLGIIVEATLRLAPAPREQQVMLLGVAEMDGLMAVFDRLRNALTLSAFEFFTDKALAHVVAHGAQPPFATAAPFYVLAEFDADEARALDAFAAVSGSGLVLDGVLGQSRAQNAALWRLREGITESLARHRPYKNDIAVRVSGVSRFMADVDRLFAAEYPDFEVVWFGHLGDGNLHISILPPAAIDPARFAADCERVTDLLGRLLHEHGGTISAEHGVGLLKKPYLKYSRDSEELALMAGLKRVFDPAGVMNPGKLL